MKTIVEVDSIAKSYGYSQVIHDCSFQIHEGEIYGLLGVNGAGKTTLMKMILGLQRADSGSIRVLGSEAGGKPVSRYSLGMKQRLGLARAIIHRPKLLILDEPLNGLDPVAITETRRLLRKLADEGMSVLLSSHIIGEIRHTADRAGILSGGNISRELNGFSDGSADGAGNGGGLLQDSGHFEDYVIKLMKGESE